MPESTKDKLVKALREAHAPLEMIDRAKNYYYDDYKSSVGNNIQVLVQDARKHGLADIAQRAMDGEFDGQQWEADDWAKSPEGQETFREFMPSKKTGN